MLNSFIKIMINLKTIEMIALRNFELVMSVRASRKRAGEFSASSGFVKSFGLFIDKI
jgi:hypothetical protein